MSDILIVLLAALIGSVIWLGIQFLAWLVGLRSVCSYIIGKELILIGLVGAPIFLFLAALIQFFLGRSISIGYVVTIPLIAAWVFFLSFLGLKLASRFIESKNPGRNTERPNNPG